MWPSWNTWNPKKHWYRANEKRIYYKLKKKHDLSSMFTNLSGKYLKPKLPFLPWQKRKISKILTGKNNKINKNKIPATLHLCSWKRHKCISPCFLLHCQISLQNYHISGMPWWLTENFDKPLSRNYCVQKFPAPFLKVRLNAEYNFFFFF